MGTRETKLFSRKVVRVALLILSLIGCTPVLDARDVFIVLSGGVSPFNNNYSQYLQAKALANYFEQHYPRDCVWTFFGAGNVDGKKTILADVRRKVERNGVKLDSWLPGLLPHNLPASRDVFLKTLREEILPAVANGGTLYLVVGDHGSRPVRTGETAIDLWGLKRDPGSERGWRSESGAELSVSDLRRALVTGIGKGRVIFCMTQCYAGGFHSLGIPNEMSPNRRWFTRMPDWAMEKSKTAILFPLAAGFTATDEFSYASGCVVDPDPKNWAGYERFIPENLMGMDLLSSRTTGKALQSFAEAHVAATLQDFTIDKPSSTSDEYLERWAVLLDARLVRELRLTSKVRQALSTYQRAVDGVWSNNSDPAFRERQKQFAQFIEKMGEQNPKAKNLLLTGTRKQLEDVIGTDGRPRPALSPNDPKKDQPPPPRRPRSRGANSETRKLWRETIQPAWKSVVESGEATNLMSFPLEFEQHLLELEDGKEKYFLSGGRSLDEEIFWFSGYGDPQTVDHAKAEAIARWGLERRTKIIAWADESDDDEVREAAKKISKRANARQVESDTSEPSEEETIRLSKKTAAERTLFYRRVLGAWEFLLAVKEAPALTRLRELTQLERTPLPLAR